jgi:hypothetical protein
MKRMETPVAVAPTAERVGLSRRGVVKLAAMAAASVVVGAHTPYGQWTVYRQRNLFIVASRTDLQALDLAQALAEGLTQELPESHARMTRASDTVRIASLLATGQLEVAIVSRQEAADMLVGAGVYKAVGPVPLCALAEFGRHLLITVESFKARHAYLVAATADHLRSSLPVAAVTTQLPMFHVPDHPGAAIFRSGGSLSEAANGD